MRSFSDRARSNPLLRSHRQSSYHHPSFASKHQALRILEWIYRQLTLKRVALAAVGIPLLIYLFSEAQRHVILLDPILVPKELADVGFTSHVVTERVRERLEDIRTIDEDQSQRDQVSMQADSDLPDIEIPETTLSLQVVSDILRRFLHNEPKHLSGEIIYSKTIAKGQVRCRLLESGDLIQDGRPREVDITNVDQAIEILAEELTELRDPGLLGVYLRDRKDLKSASELADRMFYDRSAVGSMYASAHILRSGIASDQGKLEEAANEARAAIKLAPNWLSPHLVLGNVLEAQGKSKLDDAAKEFRWVIKQEEAARSFRYRWLIKPDTYYADPHQDLGNVLADQHKFDQAIKEYREAIQFNPSYAYPHMSLGIVLETQNKPDDAAKEYRTAIQLDPKYEGPHHNLANLLDAQHKTDEAVTEYRRAIYLNPTDADPYANLADVLDEQHKTDEAVVEYRKAIQADPTDAYPHTQFGDFLERQHKTDDAIAEYQKAIQLDPTDADSHISFGNLLDEQRKRDESVTEYRKAIQLNPSDADPHTDLADVLREQHRLDESAAECRKAIQLDPTDADPHTNLGNVFMDQHNWVEAAAEYRTASQLDPTDGEPHHSLGLILKEQGSPNQADIEFKTAHKLDPNRY